MSLERTDENYVQVKSGYFACGRMDGCCWPWRCSLVPFLLSHDEFA